MRKLLTALRRLAASWRLAMCKMNQIQFSAPWTAPGPAADKGVERGQSLSPAEAPRRMPLARESDCPRPRMAAIREPCAHC